jgi:hypothetical protein
LKSKKKKKKNSTAVIYSLVLIQAIWEVYDILKTFSHMRKEQGMGSMLVIPALVRPRQENHEFKVTLDYLDTVRP